MTQKSLPKDLPYRNKGDLTTGPVRRHLVRLTLPMIWGLLAVISMQLADTYFISMLGTESLAAVSYTFPVTMILSHFVFGINIALSSVVSRLIGGKKMEDVKRIVLHGLIFAVILTTVIALTTLTFMNPLFKVLGADDTSLKIIWEYMPLWLLASIILAVPVNSNSAIRASGDTFTPALVMTTVALVNVLLDPVFIFGLFGMPEMGVSGAAFATVIANICALCLALYILIFKKDLVCLKGLKLNLMGDSLKRLIFIAIPAGITNIVMPFTNAVIVALLSSSGAEVVAAFGVVSRVEALAMLLVISLALGMAPIVGQNWGAQNFKRVHETINQAILFNFIWSALVAVALGLFAQAIAGAFSQDPVVIKYASLFFWIVPFSYAFGNLVMGWASAFNAMGMPQKAFVMIVVRSFAITIPAAYIGETFFGITGLFIALAASNLVSGMLFHGLSWRACRKNENQIEEQG